MGDRQPRLLSSRFFFDTESDARVPQTVPSDEQARDLLVGRIRKQQIRSKSADAYRVSTRDGLRRAYRTRLGVSGLTQGYGFPSARPVVWERSVQHLG